MSPQAILEAAQTWQPGDPIPVDEHGQRHFVIEKRILPWAPESLRAKVAEAIPYTEPVRPKAAPGALRMPHQPRRERPAVEAGPTRVKRKAVAAPKPKVPKPVTAGRPPLPADEIIARFMAGESAGTIAASLGCTPGSVWRIAWIAGVKRERHGNVRQFAPEVIADIVQRRINKQSAKAIEKALGVPRKQIGLILKREAATNQALAEALSLDVRIGGACGPRAFCIKGHAMTPENTYTRMRGARESRQCRTCMRACEERKAARRKERRG